MKRLVSIALSMLLFFSFIPRAAAQTVPTVRFVAARYTGQFLSVSYRMTDGAAGQEVTALVYSRLADGEQGELLQVHQADAPAAGVHTLALAVAPSPYGYLVQLGGTAVTITRQIVVENSYLAAGVGFAAGQTVEQFSHSLAGLSDIAVTRGGEALSDTDEVQPGDTLSATLNGTSFTACAVIYGDVNLDETVNAVDALQVLRHGVGKTTLTGAALAAADFNQNGVINAVNALRILQLAVGKIPVL